MLPTITVKKRNLLNMIDASLSNEELQRLINLIKPEVEEVTTDEISYELNPDRSDLFSSPGLARAINGFLGRRVGLPQYDVCEKRLSVKVEEVKVRPYFACAIVKGLQLSDTKVEELMEFQEALTNTLGRHRRKVAIGLHDLSKLVPPIRYIAASPSATMIPLQLPEELSLEEILSQHPKGKKFGHLIAHAKAYPAIVDQRGIFSFPPIINSERTRITGKVKEIFIDLTGTSLPTINDTMNVLITSLAERGGIIEKVEVIYPDRNLIFPRLKPKKKVLEVRYVNKLLGLDLSQEEVVEQLEKARYGTKTEAKGQITVKIPPYRPDVLHPVDIIEDVSIAYGFNNFSSEPSKLATIGRLHPLESFSNNVRGVMTGLGFQEIMTPTLVGKEVLIDQMRLREEEVDVVELSNPVSTEYQVCRNSILPSLLDFLSKNTHISFPQKVYELEDVVVIDKKSPTKTKNVKKLAAVISDHQVGYSDIRANIDALLNCFAIPYEVTPTEDPSFIKGRVGKLTAKMQGKKRPFGRLGEVHPKVILNFSLEKPTAAFELDVEKLYTFSSVTEA